MLQKKETHRGNETNSQSTEIDLFHVGIDYNLRGINTYNLFKRVIWSCATFRPNGEKDEYCEVNLPLLKGYLYEIKNEVYVEDINLKLLRDPSYKLDDINSLNGFSDYKPVDDHPRIQM